MSALMVFDQAYNMLMEAKTVDEVKRVVDMAEQMRIYAKQVQKSQEMQNALAEIKIRAQRRGGELLRDVPRATAGRKPDEENSVQGGLNFQQTTSWEQTVADSGLTLTTAKRWQDIAAIPEPVFEAHIEQVKKSDEELTSASALRLAAPFKDAPQEVIDVAVQWNIITPAVVERVKHHHKHGNSTFDEIRLTGHVFDPVKEVSISIANEDAFLEAEAHIVQTHKQQARQARIWEAQNLPDGYFNVVYADPPWQYSNSGLNGAAEQHYNTLSTPDICTFPETEAFKSKIADRAVLFMWVTNSHIPDAMQVLDAWGFTYKANFVWIKDKSAYGNLAFYNKGQHELMFVATRGTMTPLIANDGLPTSIIEASKGIHSRKPDVYGLIERLYPDCNYVELFGRWNEPRKSWVFWGDESDASAS